MSRRHKRKTPRERTGASRNAQSGGLQADPKLVKLLDASLAMPGPCFAPIPGTTKLVVRDDLWMIALSIRDRCKELGGDAQPHMERALAYMAQRGRG